MAATVATQTLKYNGKYYRPGESVPVTSKDLKRLKAEGLITEQVSPADVQRATEIQAKIQGLRDAVEADGERLEVVDNEIAAAKPVASKVSKLKAAADKGDGGAQAELETALEAQKALDALNVEREALEKRLESGRAALKALA